ncbi:unnamed protein product [Trifolium pratense]|uniref:Uncharacterized protein n=1 Tax=Trifolium pratense TaxID=57577 RepID=A0ACB0IBF0_TRIPR|nr:unnamed protein product [Trifolium pratense]
MWIKWALILARNEEMEERRAKGLCFKCGGKFHPTLHKCPEKSLCLLILGEGETLNDEGEIVALEVEDEEEEEELEAECKLIGVLGKMGECNTMKLEARLASVDIEVLVDSGASHSFISPALTTALSLKVTPTTVKKIKLGDGHRVMSEGICKGIKLTLGSKVFEVDALVLEPGGLDMVLGVPWLSTLGMVVMDWKDLSMQFWHKGEMVTLHGQGSGQLQQGCLNSFLGGGENKWNCDGWWTQLEKEEKTVEAGQQGMKGVLKLFP